MSTLDFAPCHACGGAGNTPIAYPVDNEGMALAMAPECKACDGTGEAVDEESVHEEARLEAHAAAMGDPPQGEVLDAEWAAHEDAFDPVSRAAIADMMAAECRCERCGAAGASRRLVLGAYLGPCCDHAGAVAPR